VDVAAFELEFREYPVVAYGLGGGGILGGDLLRHFAVTLDYKYERLLVAEAFDAGALPTDIDLDPEVQISFELLGGGRGAPAGCGGAGCTVVFPATRVIVDAWIGNDSAPIAVAIDSGSSFVLLSPTIFESLPGDTSFKRISSLALGSRAVGGPAVVIEDVEATLIPDPSVFDNLSREVDRPVLALVGGPFLQSFLTTIDYPQHLLRLSRYRTQ
jgi:hypothetical protein